MTTAVERLQPQRFTMHSGNAKRIRINVLDRLKEPVELTGGSAVLRVAREAGAANLFTVNGTLPGSPLNQIVFDIPTADTEPLSGAYYWECTYTDLAGRPSTVAYGFATVKINQPTT